MKIWAKARGVMSERQRETGGHRERQRETERDRERPREGGTGSKNLTSIDKRMNPHFRF